MGVSHSPSPSEPASKTIEEGGSRMETDKEGYAPLSLEARVSTLEQRVSKLEERMDRLEDVVKGIYREIGEIRGRLEEGLRGLKAAMTIGFTLTGTILAAILYVLYMLAAR